MIPVNSRAIRAVGYDPSTQRLRITFEQGDSYDFCGVPVHVYEGLMSASSKGTYYNDYIRDRYQCF
ncbi:MAG TPA: KTSC domain-containing protein [Gammaproteobacteria bacterium]|nr:KTSC domain-containing protein [Gammaproteobacteria bacterium]